jgi:hypothetical protein
MYKKEKKMKKVVKFFLILLRIFQLEKYCENATKDGVGEGK